LQELEKRIFEHDTCVEEKKPDELLAVTLEQVHVAEKAAEQARQRAQAAAQRFDSARLALRESQAAARKQGGEEGGEKLVGMPIDIKVGSGFRVQVWWSHGLASCPLLLLL
jgi:hypothetical protein